MKTRYLLPIFGLFASAHLSAQHAADKWYFGTMAGIDFTGGTPAAIGTSVMSAGEGSASIANPLTGALLFYTDGISVWNSSNAVMPNGTDLMGGFSSTQPALIVPKPESATEYYIFTTDQIGGALGLRYSIVDMSLQGGSGDVTTKNALLKTPVTEKVTAVQDAGTTNVWMLAHGWGNDAFYAFKITPAGIDSAVVSNVGIVHADDVIQNSYGQLKFNPCGDKVALAAGYLDKVELFDFNIVTGAVSNAKTISYGDHVYGVEFSSNSDVLYVSTYQENANLLQYDLTIADVNTMVTEAEIISMTPDIYPLQRGPDDKIYACKSFSQYLGVINSPNTIGAGCNYVDMGFDLDPTFMGYNSGLGLPNIVTSYTGDVSNCIGSTNAIGEHAALAPNTVFPNPSSADFTFVAQHDNAQVVVRDIAGKTLAAWEQVSAGTTFRFGAGYAPGVYVVTAMDAAGNAAALKIVKE